MKESALLFLKGLLMGASDIVPGVSGGTMAFITGIYDRLITSIKHIGTFLRLLAQKLTGSKHEWKTIWSNLHLRFFIPLGLGVLLALGLGSHFIPDLMQNYPVATFSFFIGLILASAYHVYTHITRHDIQAFLFGALGLVIGILISLLPVSEGNRLLPLPLLFLLAAIAICAMILPGISGSYILLMFGQYEPVLHALKELDLVVISVFAAGAAIGLLTFARILSWLLRHYHTNTFYVLLGLMIGALTGLFQTVDEAASSTGDYVIGAVFFVVGAMIVLAIDWHARRLRA